MVFGATGHAARRVERGGAGVIRGAPPGIPVATSTRARKDVPAPFGGSDTAGTEVAILKSPTAVRERLARWIGRTIVVVKRDAFAKRRA